MPRVMILFLLSILPLFLAACDRETAPAGQAEPANAGKSAKAGFGLESAGGLKAELSYHFAGRAAPDAVLHGADGREVARIKTGIVFFNYTARAIAPIPAPFMASLGRTPSTEDTPA